MSLISNRLDQFDSSYFQRAVRRQQTLQNPIDLSIGIPEELTPEHVKAAGIHAIQNDHTTYTPANGIPELREALAHKLAKQNGIPTDANDITVVPGLTTGQLLVYLAIIDPGDEVIVFDPYYPPYPHLAEMVGGQVTYVSTLPNFQPNLQVLEATMTHRTKAIVINSPNNPSGAVYPEETLRKIVEMADAYNAIIISDEIYEHFNYTGKHFSVGSIYPNTITMNGFSKEYAMTGWRVGYISGPTEIIQAINKLQQYVVMSSSSIAQHAAFAALTHTQRPNLLEKYREKRDLLVGELTRMGYEVSGADGAFFTFIKAPNGMTDVEFVEKAADHNLILVPGSAFSKLHGHVRISYGASKHDLVRGLEIIQNISA